MAPKAFSKEELNFFKFASIVLDEFPKMLRSTFVTLWNTKIAPLPGYHEWDDTPEVRQLFLAREGGTSKIPVSDSFEKWDCTALFQATIFSKSFGIFMTSPTTKKTPTIKTLSDQFIKGKKPSPFHLSLISPTRNHDETIALAIDQVRLLRNTLCHSSESSIKRDDFDNYVRHAKDAFDAVKFSTSQIDNIAILKEEDFPTDKFNELSKKIVADLQGSNKFLQAIITAHIDERNLFQESVLEKLDKIEKNTKDQDSKKDSKTETGQENRKFVAYGALCSKLSSDGGDFSFRITAEKVQVTRDLGVTDVTLEQLFDACEIMNPTVFQKATKRGFGDERDDQEFKKFKKGSLFVSLHCFTDEGFLEVLEDFKSGRLKDRLLKEYSLIGVIVEGMEIEIMNMDEVNKTKEAIMKRIKQGKEENEKQRLEEKGSVEEPCDDILILPKKDLKKEKEEDDIKDKSRNPEGHELTTIRPTSLELKPKQKSLKLGNILSNYGKRTPGKTIGKFVKGLYLSESQKRAKKRMKSREKISGTGSEETARGAYGVYEDMSEYQHPSRRYNTFTTPEDSRYNPQDMSEYQHPSGRYINRFTTPEDSRYNPQDISEYQHPSGRYINRFTTPEDSRYNPQKYEHRSARTRIRRRHQKRISGKTPKKNVEDIQDISEMLGLFRLLHIAHDLTKLDLSEMKKTAKRVLEDQGSGSGKYSYGTTGFGVIAMTKDEDMLKRETLLDFNLQVEDCVRQLGSHAIEVLDVYYSGGSVLNVLGEERKRLTKTEYNILIAGESSAGKSSLVNLILGEELLPHHNLNTTFTICEVKYGEKRELIAHYNYDEEQMMRPSPEIHPLRTKEECGKNYCEQIAPFVQRKSNERSKYTRVEIFWPHELLEEEIVIVDSPGLGESDEMDDVLMNYLPNAFAFIYVLDAFRAGGIQKDIKEKLRNIIKKVKSSDGGVETLQHLAECSLFICNKWDQVKVDERSEAKEHVVAKLRECWEDSNLNHQIVYMSITEAIEVQEYGGVTEKFNDLLQKIKTMVLRAINTRLYNHWQSLYALLYQIYRVTYFFNQEVQSTHQETRERMEEIERRIEKIERKEQDVKREMEERVKTQTKVLQAKLEVYIYSMDFKTKFCSWTNCALPKREITWEMTKRNIKEAIDSRFKELLIEWENDHQVYAEIHREILDEFRKSLILLEEELEGVDKAMYSVDRRAYHSGNKNKIPLKAKVIFGVISPLLIPFGVAGLVIGMPVLGALGIKGKVDKKKKIHKFINNPLEQLRKRSEKFLERLPKEYVLQYAQRLMENTRMVLSRYGDQIPTLIEADRKLVTQLFNDRRTQSEILGMYDPIQKKSLEIIYEILPWGIKLCPATINASDLDWKKDHSSCLGEGEVSRVYKGKLKNLGRNKSETSEMNVAVKVFKKQFDESNSRYFLQEELQIRDLRHKNVLKYFGAARTSDNTLLSDDNQFIFVMEAARQNLRTVIFKSRILTPGESENYKLAIGKFIKRAMDIAEGLNYIHERGLIHRHLKLENILEGEDGTVLLSDVGIVGQFLETEKSITYLAPEVLEDLTNRTKEADMYSYGIVLWEMWYGAQAFTELMPIKRDHFQEQIAGGHRPKRRHTTINIPLIHALMEKCWATEVKERHSSKECYEKLRELNDETNATDTEHLI